MAANPAEDVEPNGTTGYETYTGQPKVHYGLGAVNYHTGETVVIIRRRKRRKEVAELLEALLEKHPQETIYVAWGNASTHQGEEIEAVV